MTNKYYICHNCGELTTERRILNDCSNGSVGMCYCQFTMIFWNDEFNSLDVDTPRIYNQYIEINKRNYDRLKQIINDVLRLAAFKEIPKSKR